MKERAPGLQKPEINSRQTATTDVGKIVKFTLTNNGTSHIVFSHIESELGLEKVLKQIENNKIWTKNPIVINALKTEAKTPEEFIKARSLDYIEALKAKKNIREFREDILFSLIKQKALEQLFKSAEKSRQ